MLLCIDSGNTNIVFAVFDDDDKMLEKWRASSNSNRTADEFEVLLGQLISSSNITVDDINACIIASVVPASLYTLKSLCRDYFSCEPMVIGEEGVELGIEIKVDQPSDVGADRLVNAVSAYQQYKSPMIIIDFGTATTFDVIDLYGNYIGGVIAPGVNLSLEALHMTAAQLPRVDIQRTSSVIGKNTIEAMQSGIYWGYVGLIEGLVKRLSEEHKIDISVIATGGLASLFNEATDFIAFSDPDLTLSGLVFIYRRNSCQ
jgi:type III pantothenate kinase